ncbi:MAG: hypothetical protein AB7E79_16470 [Rhodospirillaceae bacterium]
MSQGHSGAPREAAQEPPFTVDGALHVRIAAVRVALAGIRADSASSDDAARAQFQRLLVDMECYLAELEGLAHAQGEADRRGEP